MTQAKLTIFYDGLCPLCSLEMNKLKQYDVHNRIVLRNLHNMDFNSQFTHIDFDDAMAILHGEYKGQILKGLDVTHRAWTLVGKGYWVAPLRLPLIKHVAHYCYLFVAKYRQPISHFLYSKLGIGNNTCESGHCNVKSNYNYNRRK